LPDSFKILDVKDLVLRVLILSVLLNDLAIKASCFVSPPLMPVLTLLAASIIFRPEPGGSLGRTMFGFNVSSI
jgi:hypothetical protein